MPQLPKQLKKIHVCLEAPHNSVRQMVTVLVLTRCGDGCRWYRPGPPFVPVKVLDLVRKVLGFVPLTMWGRYGSPVPHKVSMPFNSSIVLLLSKHSHSDTRVNACIHFATQMWYVFYVACGIWCMVLQSVL